MTAIVRTQRLYFLLILSFLLLPGFIGSETTAQNPTTHEIKVQDNRFVPNELQIDIGDEVVFVWEGDNGHNVAQVDSRLDATYDEGFRSGDPVIVGNWTLDSSFTQTNITLYYICEPHVFSNTMRGKIIVGEGSPDEPEEPDLGTLWVLIGIFVLLLFGAFYIVVRKSQVEAEAQS